MKKTIKQIDKQMEMLQKEKEQFLNKGEEIKFKGKTFRIIKWENKELGDFNMPEGWDFAEHSDFIELFDNKLIDYPEKDYITYFVKHYSKRKQKAGFLSGCYLSGGSDMGSYYSYLSYSIVIGRVVLVEVKK